MSKKLNVDTIKVKSYQDEAKKCVESFRDSLQQHFNIVHTKAKNLIDKRWESVEADV
jgi:glutamine amidotransferase-like uncharacterized protein